MQFWASSFFSGPLCPIPNQQARHHIFLKSIAFAVRKIHFSLHNYWTAQRNTYSLKVKHLRCVKYIFTITGRAAQHIFLKSKAFVVHKIHFHNYWTSSATLLCAELSSGRCRKIDERMVTDPEILIKRSGNINVNTE